MIFESIHGQYSPFGHCPWQTNLQEREQVASFLIEQLRIMNYFNGNWFKASDLVGESQFDWENMEPLNFIVEAYPDTTTQKTVLGKILKRALFDHSKTFEMRMDYVAHYRIIE